MNYIMIDFDYLEICRIISSYYLPITTIVYYYIVVGIYFLLKYKTF